LVLLKSEFLLEQDLPGLRGGHDWMIIFPFIFFE
jgi:hypothetical protein